MIKIKKIFLKIKTPIQNLYQKCIEETVFSMHHAEDIIQQIQLIMCVEDYIEVRMIVYYEDLTNVRIEESIFADMDIHLIFQKRILKNIKFFIEKFSKTQNKICKVMENYFTKIYKEYETYEDYHFPNIKGLSLEINC